MKTQPAHAALLGALLFLAGNANAQSPWESGSYKDYSPQPSGVPPSGLDGYAGTAPQVQPQAQQPASVPSLSSDVVAPAQPQGTTVFQSAIPTPARPTTTQPQPGQPVQPSTPGKFNPTEMAARQDQLFAKTTMQTLQAVVSASQIALQKASGSDIKSLAKQTIAQFQPVVDKLTSVATSEQLETSTQMDPLRSHAVSVLNSTAPADFDQKYVTMQKSQLNELIFSFNKETKSGKSDGLKSFVGQNLPVMQSQLQALDQYTSKSPT